VFSSITGANYFAAQVCGGMVIGHRVNRCVLAAWRERGSDWVALCFHVQLGWVEGENGWVVTVRDLLECVQGKQYAFTDRRALGDFVAEWYREPERVATNRVPFYDGGLNSEGV
jgi:hypothetical protein